MDREVLADPAVAGYANENYVVYAVDAEKGEGPDLAKKYKVTGFPTFVLVDAGGDELERQAGASGKNDFLVLLKDVRAGNHAKALAGRVEKDPEDGEARALLGVKLARRGDPAARPHLEKAAALDPESRGASTVEARYWIALLDARNARSVDPIAAFAGKFPESPSAVQAHRILAAEYERMGREDLQVESLGFLVKRAPDAESRNNLSWFLATHGRELERALALVEEALKEKPDVSAYLDTRAECLSRLGRHDEAVEAQKKAVACLADGIGDEERAMYESRLRGFERKRDEAKAAK